MGYLICDQCGGYYELKEGESPEDFEINCECGGILKTINNLEEYYDNKSNMTLEGSNSLKDNLKDKNSFCQQCGSENPDYANFCQECGNEINNDNNHDLPQVKFADKNSFNSTKLKDQVQLSIFGWNGAQMIKLLLAKNSVIVGKHRLYGKKVDYNHIAYEHIANIKFKKDKSLLGSPKTGKIFLETKKGFNFTVGEVRIGVGENFVNQVKRILSGDRDFLDLNLEIKTDEIPIYSGKVNNQYTECGQISVRADSSLFSKTATMNDVNGRLREEAVKLGANAIINTNYQRSNLTSWRGIKASGVAVFIEPEEKKCPFCAEMIKKEAIKCKHCGSDLK